MSDLTQKQTEVLLCIADMMKRNGGPPTRKEIAHQLGFSSANAAQQHLKALERKGYLHLLNGKSRGITIRPMGQRIIAEHFGEDALLGSGATLHDSTGIPVIGRVAAGQPILSDAHIDTYYQISSDIFHPPADYLLRVEGDSMKDCGILNGDLLAVRANTTQQTPRNGQIVVARVDEAVTVKRFQHENPTDPIVRLLPENSDPLYQPIKVDVREQALQIEGFGVGVIRNQPESHFGGGW